MTLLAAASHGVVETTAEILEQAEQLEKLGFDAYDAPHLASAASAKADVFLTTDDKLQKSADKTKNVFSFIVANPVKWLEEALK